MNFFRQHMRFLNFLTRGLFKYKKTVIAATVLGGAIATGTGTEIVDGVVNIINLVSILDGEPPN